jgi:hypothetical protein
MSNDLKVGDQDKGNDGGNEADEDEDDGAGTL